MESRGKWRPDLEAERCELCRDALIDGYDEYMGMGI
jgi:hypothetical protein